MTGGAQRSKISFLKISERQKKNHCSFSGSPLHLCFSFAAKRFGDRLKISTAPQKLVVFPVACFFPLVFFIFVEFRLIIGLLLQLPNTKLPREIYVKAENSGEINVFLCHDQSPENSPMASGDGYVRSSTGAGAGAGGSGVRTATSTRLHPLTNQRLQDPLFNNIDAMSTKGLGELQDQVIQSCSLIFLIIFPKIILLIFFAFCL